MGIEYIKKSSSIADVSITLAPVYENECYKDYLKRCSNFRFNRDVCANFEETFETEQSIRDTFNISSSNNNDMPNNKTQLTSLDNMFTSQELQEIDKISNVVDMVNEKELDCLSVVNSNVASTSCYSLLDNNEEDVIEFENKLESLYSTEHKNDLDFENNPLRTPPKPIDDRPRDANGRYIKKEDNKTSMSTSSSKSNINVKISKSSSSVVNSSKTQSSNDIELENEPPKRKRGRPKKVKVEDE